MARTLTVISRSLGSYYQRNDSGPPVAPDLNDPSIDIDKETKLKYINYLADATGEVNNIPISRSYAARSFEYGDNFRATTSENAKQTYYAENLEPSNIPSDTTTHWFPREFSTSDDLGVHYNATQFGSRRSFAVKRYMADPTNSDPATDPTKTQAEAAKTIDRALLNATGYNEANKYIPQNVLSIDNNPVNGPDYKRRLGTIGYQGSKLGLYRTGSHVGQQGNPTPPNNTQLTIEDMQKVGLNLLFDAVQGEAGLGFKIESESDFTEAEARMAIPSLPRIGKKTSLSRFTPANTLKKLTSDQYNPSSVTNFYDNTNDVQTNGSYYSPYNQFDSLVSLGQIALAIAMILAFVLLLEGIAGIMAAAASDPTGRVETQTGLDAQGGLTSTELQKLLGTSKLSGRGGVYPDNNTDAGDFFNQLLGTSGLFANTYHNSGTCLDVGIAEFFGFSFGNQGRAVSSAASTSLRVLTESGRITTVLREVLRSGISVIEGGIADFSGGFSIASLGKLIRKIADLKIIKFINVLRQIGDKVLFESEIKQRIPEAGVSGSNSSYVDSLADQREYYIAKSRLKNGNNPRNLAWSTETAGMLSLPFLMYNTVSRNNLELAISGTVLPEQLYGNQLNDNIWQEGQKRLAEQNGRIDPSVASRYEEMLESDYMPFYIQDLRTNEILSFHAFLEDVGEDFNVDYTTVEGYGRMDKVHIYKSTTRNVNVTFKMIATNDEDHAIMWYKINKLVMTIYPQWTQGREINFGSRQDGNDLNFIQPFSQIPGATPVIRLRLGDLFKSNYSTMAVARLFGASTLPNYKVDNSQQSTSVGSTTPTSAAGTPQTNQTPTSSPTPSGRTTSPVTAQATPPAATGGAVAESGAAATTLVQIRINDPVVLKYETETSRVGTQWPTENQHYTTSPSTDARQQRGDTIINPGDNVRLIGICQEIVNNEFYRFKVTHLQGNPETVQIPIHLIEQTGRNRIQLLNLGEVNHYITISRSQLSAGLDISKTNAEIARKRVTERIASEPTRTPSIQMTTRDFYNPNSNPIIKAFKNSGGKGLAGVITQFKIDSKDQTWGTNKTSLLRAPIMVTINLTMAVIHDIVPGLDANGIMNAPIWPVGKHSNFFMDNTSGPTETNTGHYYFNNSRIRKR
jgi:hypothetical protein